MRTDTEHSRQAPRPTGLIDDRRSRAPGTALTVAVSGDPETLGATPGGRRLTRSGGTRALNLRLQVALHERYRGLLRTGEDDGIKTSLTEIVHALLLDGPGDVDELRVVLRRYRRAVDDL